MGVTRGSVSIKGFRSGAGTYEADFQIDTAHAIYVSSAQRRAGRLGLTGTSICS